MTYLGKGKALMGKKVYIAGDGCNRRLLEIDKIKSYLKTNGYQIIDRPELANYMILTTCAFKKDEEDRSIEKLRDLKRFNTEMLVYGCLPSIAPNRWKEFDDTRFLAPKDLNKIDTYFTDLEISFSEIENPNFISPAKIKNRIQGAKENLRTQSLFSGELILKTKAIVKKAMTQMFTRSQRPFYLFVCSGCLGKCSYCAIKRSIGKVNSKPINQLIEEFIKGYLEGYRNFTVLGDEPGCYGIDINESFPVLMSNLLSESKRLSQLSENNGNAKGMCKFFINEIHPKYLIKYRTELTDLISSKEIKGILCPVQSGNNRVLESMNREHTIETLSELINTFKKENPELKLSTQIIVGYPSETQSEFNDTLRFLKESPFESVVIFPYHEKQNTPAANLPDKVPYDEILKRQKYAYKFLRRNRIKTYTKCPA